jgi:4-amino-4-deoxy-L-arabinose transferase-like glycosyltransferase
VAADILSAENRQSGALPPRGGLPVKRSTYVVLLSLLVALSALVRLYHFDITIGSDDQRYIIAARSLVQQEPIQLNELMYVRIGFRAFLAATTSLLGGVTLDHAAYVMFFLSSASTLLVGLIAREVSGPAASLIAAAMHATLPLNILWDVVTLADSLAVPLLLLSVFLFVRYLGSGRLGTLIASGLCAGLLFSVKDYFVLIFGCYALALLLHAGGWRQRCGRVGVLIGCAVVGVVVPCLLHLWESGQWQRAIKYGKTYCDIAGVMGIDWGYVSKLYYFKWLIFDGGGYGGIGILYLLGIAFLVFKAPRDEKARIVALAGFAFLAFLSFMPISFRPLRFIEQQPRYLLAVEPFLAVGVGGALGLLLRSCTDGAVRRAAVAVLVLFCAFQAWSPNVYAPCLYGRHTVGTAVRGSVVQARAHGLHTVVLPNTYDQIVPDSFRQLGCELVYAPPGPDFAQVSVSGIPLGTVDPYLDRNDVAVFLPSSFRTFEPKQYEHIRCSLEKKGYRPVAIFFPLTSTECWRIRLGVHPDRNAERREPTESSPMSEPNTLVGHLYVKEGS